MEGSEGQTAADASKRGGTCDDLKYSVLTPCGKSVIEEWRNPPKYTEDLLRDDRSYEERAVDVAVDSRRSRVDSLNGLPRSAPPSKLGDVTDDKLIKIKRPQGGGTVRSIPIKDYQASIAHNIGTLRRSAAPQSQFESLVSEPDKSARASSRGRDPAASGLHHRTVSRTEPVRKKLFCHFCNSRHDRRDCADSDSNRIGRHAEDNLRSDKAEEQRSRDCSDIDEYFRRSSRRRFGSNDHRASIAGRARLTPRGDADATADTTNERANGAAEQEGATALEESHVGRKISAYEENARRSLRDAGPRYRSVLEVKGHHRAIGVPLVGMHNACGLPVVASWNDHELLEPLRVSRRIAGTVGPVYRSSRTIPNARRRTQPKRRAPQPDREAICSQPKDADRGGVKRSTIRSSTAHLNAVDDRLSRRRYRRSSFSKTRAGSLSSRNSFKRTGRSRRHGIKVSSLVDTFGRRSIKRDGGKRTTLYAKDDGEEAVQVLRGLCLNPLARANPETDVMW